MGATKGLLLNGGGLILDPDGSGVPIARAGKTGSVALTASFFA